MKNRQKERYCFPDEKIIRFARVDQISGPLPWAKIDGNKEHRKILEYKARLPRKIRFQQEKYKKKLQLQIRQGEPRQKFFESIPYQFEEIMDKIDGYRLEKAKIRKYKVQRKISVNFQRWRKILKFPRINSS